jgi:WD40 repeat protein
LLETFEGHEFSVVDMSFLPDGKKAVSASWDRNLILWDIETGELIRQMTGQNADLFSVAVDPSGRFALVGSGDGHLILWDLETGETIRNYQAHEAPVSHISFTPEGDIAISNALDGAVRIWRVDRTLDELLSWVEKNRLNRVLTCDERALYQVEPFCE